jgi:GT2 family glycosyltransferase
MSQEVTAPAPSSERDPLVVVVAYHAPDLLDRCLDDLGTGFDVVVVDNSSDARVAGVADRYGVTYVDPGRNLGFGAGVNIGCTGRDGRDVLLLNPDATISPGGVRTLHAALRCNRRLAAVAPRQHDPTHRSDARVAWPFPTPGGAWLEAAGLGRLRRRTDFLIGSVLLLSGAALDDVGGFDEQFFLYAE